MNTVFQGVPKGLINKKVLLRERKRHTARRVASTPYVVLTWVPPPLVGVPGGYPGQGGYPGGGYTQVRYPPARVPPQLTWLGGVPDLGTPPARVPPPGWTWQLQSIVGYGYPPPPGGCPMAFWEMLQSIMGYGYPPPPGVDRLKTLPSPSYGCGR